MKKCVVEFIGTFFLVLTIGCAVLPGGAGAMAPLAIGSILMVMVFAGGYVSGAHFNPAVTLAVWIRGKCSTTDMLCYIPTQIVAGAIAALLATHLRNYPTVTAAAPDVVRALIAEFLFTFALCYVVLNVATAKGTSGNPTYGLAIGFTVLAGACAVGDISGGTFNPAVAIGITMMGLSKLANIWIFFAANLAGGAVAGLLFKALHPHDN